MGPFWLLPALGLEAARVRVGRLVGLAPSLGLEGTVTGFYGSPRQVLVSFDVKF